MRSAVPAVIASLLLGGAAAGAAHASEDAEAGLASLQLGLALLESGKPRQAALAFERAAELDPELAPLALYNAAVAYANAGDLASAARRARDVLALDPHPLAARSARQLLEQVEGRRWSLRGQLGLLWDDNVSQREADVSSGRSDGAGVVDLGASYRLLQDAAFDLEAGYDFSQTAYFHESDFDLQSHGFGLSAARGLGPVEGVFDYRYSLATLGGDWFLGFHELSPSLEFAPAPGWHALVGPRLLVKSFEDSARDALQSGLGVDGYFFPNQVSERFPVGSYAAVGLGFQHEDAAAAEYDFTGFGLRVGLHLPFALGSVGHEVDVSYRLRWQDYAHRTPAIGQERLDAIHTTRLRLSRDLGELLKLRLEYQFLRSTSNLPTVDYDQNTLSLGLAFAL